MTMLVCAVSKRFTKGCNLNHLKAQAVVLTLSRNNSHGFARKLPGFEEEKEDILNFPHSSQAKTALEKYYELRERALQGGGPKGVERHVQRNKKVLVRDRVSALLDPGSPFLEIGDLAGFEMDYGDIPTAGVVAGIGKISGVFCMVSGNDATVKAGSYYPITVIKSYRCQEISEMIRLPTVYMPDSGGAFLPLQSEIFPDKKHGGRAFYNQAVMSSKGIHQVALVCGSCTAGGAYNPTMSDEAIIVDKIGKIFLAGPPLVRAATGETVTDEELGGAFVHSGISGCTDYFANTEEEAFTMCRDIVYSLNMNSGTDTIATGFEEPAPTLAWKDVAENKLSFSKLDLYVILSGILDGSKFHEFKVYYGPQAITGTGCIEGRRVGVVANIEDVGVKEAFKITHFINMCNRRKLPIIFLQNANLNEEPCNAIMEDSEEETDLLKARGALASMIATTNVPKIAVTLSGLSPVGSLTMCGPSFGSAFHFLWPQAKISNFQMVSSAEHTEIVDAFYAAAHMLVDAIIPPSQTRSTISTALQIAEQQNFNPEPVVDTSVLRM